MLWIALATQARGDLQGGGVPPLILSSEAGDQSFPVVHAALVKHPEVEVRRRSVN